MLNQPHGKWIHRWRAFGVGERPLDSLPAYSLLNVITIPPSVAASPWSLIARRILYALILLFAIAGLVYLGRDGYSQPLTFIDALYYSTVSLSTTGYGDIAPVSQSARLFNIIVITPARIAFLILLVGTTLAVLTENSRKTWRIQRWRSGVRNHTIVIGYGTKGRSAVAALQADGIPVSQIVVIDTDEHALTRAEREGLVTVRGNGTKSDVLTLAGVSRARSVVVAPSSDEAAVLVTLSVRELAPETSIVAAVRESENQHLLLQSGADSVVISSETAGRLLGLATVTPSVVEIMEDLLSPDEGLAVTERAIKDSEVGKDPRDLEELAMGVVRNKQLYRVGRPQAETIEAGDRLLYIRRTIKED